MYYLNEADFIHIRVASWSRGFVFYIMAKTALGVIVVFLLCQTLNLSRATNTQQPCRYPTESLICKVWNYTNLDCANRKLDCIPLLTDAASLEFVDLHNNHLQNIPDNTFKSLVNLLTLDLSYNTLSSIHNNGFRGLSKLTHLDLSVNELNALTYPPFQHLDSLQALDLSRNHLNSLNATFVGLKELRTLNLSGNNLTSIASGTFDGIKNLQILYIQLGYSIANITSNVFSDLSSLRQLNITLELDSPDYECHQIEKIFSGLKRLENLSLNHRSLLSCDYNFCSLTSLTTFNIYGGNISIIDNCFKAIPLKSLTFFPSSSSYIQYRALQHLVHLNMGLEMDDIMVLGLLDSPIHNLSLTLYMFDAMNSSTFESLTKWNTSLRVLDLTLSLPSSCKYSPYYHTPCIKGSPFKWFSNLQVLRMKLINNQRQHDQYTLGFSVDTFNGLPNLRELHLNYFKTNIFKSGALFVFGSTTNSSLQVLNMSHNEMYGYIPYDQLCPITSLEILDLSYNELSGFYSNQSCMLQNLKTLSLQNAPGIYSQLEFPSNWNLQEICQNTPNLHSLDASRFTYTRMIMFSSFSCPKLVTLNLSQNNLGLDKVHTIHVPSLEYLYLQDFNWDTFRIKDLNVF